MSISYKDVFQLLLVSVVGVEADEEDRIEPTPYFFLADIVRFVCAKVRDGSLVEAKQLALLFDKLFAEGDEDVKDLAMDGLESLSDNCEYRDAIVSLFSDRVMDAWRKVSTAY